MWILFFKRYKNSAGATAVSVLGALMRYAGAMVTFEGYLLPAGVIFFAVGIGLHFLAEYMSFSKLTSYIESQGYADRIRLYGDIDLAIDIYSDYPEKKTLRYIKSLNELVGLQLENIIINMVSNKNR